MRDAVYWFNRRTAPLPPLAAITTADVVVVGGGMMGLMCARTLAARGMSVSLVEATTCGGAASGRSSGFITPDSELEFADLVEHFGPQHAPKLWEFACGGLNLIRTAIKEHAIDCDYCVQDALMVAARHRAAGSLTAEHDARGAAGFASTLHTSDTLPAALGGACYFGGLRFTGTFGIDAYRCCVGLREHLRATGVRIFEQSPVTRLSSQGVETAAGRIDAAHVVVCTDRFLPLLGLAPREVYHAQTFLAISEPLPDAELSRLFPQGPLMVWDTALVYQYFRITGEQRLLIGGGTLASTYAARERHDPEWVARRLSSYLARHFPWLRLRFHAAWPGLIGISKDFAPLIGRHPTAANVHFAGGAAGLPWAAALGRYLADKIANGRNDLDPLLAVDRDFPIGPRLQSVIGRRVAFALSHGIMKLRA